MIRNQDRENIQSYGDACRIRVSQTQSREMQVNYRRVYGILEKFDLYGKYPAGICAEISAERGSYWQLNSVFREVIDIYKDSGAKRGLKESTLYRTAFSASSFLLAMQNRGRESLNDITEDDVISYFVREDGRSPLSGGYRDTVASVFKSELGIHTEPARRILAYIPVIRLFIEYLHKHGQTDTLPPPVLKQNKKRRIPHAFSQEELERFFHECDSIIPCRGRMAYASELRRVACPVFFRLLYSSGIRTTESRFLMRSGVDLGHGVPDIQKSKGYDQHYVALHPSITELLERYDRAADRLCPDRTYFFESPTGQPYSRAWVSHNFSVLWKKANGKKGNAVAYDLRHNYATANINSWKGDVFGFNDRLHYLARSMGHRDTESTLYYYSVVPRLADMIQEKTEERFNSIVPEVNYEEE